MFEKNVKEKPIYKVGDKIKECEKYKNGEDIE